MGPAPEKVKYQAQKAGGCRRIQLARVDGQAAIIAFGDLGFLLPGQVFEGFWVPGSVSVNIAEIFARQIQLPARVVWLFVVSIYLTDVSGVLDAEQRPIARLSVEDANELIDQGVARGGMEAKLRAAISALEQGADEIRIAAGAEPNGLTRLLNGEPLGTVLAKRAWIS